MSKPLYSILVLFIIALAVKLIYCAPVNAQEQSFQLSTGDALTVEGEDFIFETRSIVSGEEVVLQDVAVWEGGVTARFSEITLQTGHIEAVFSGPEVSRLMAGPQVSLTDLDERAYFECSDVDITFPTAENGMSSYSGICRNVIGSYRATSEELGLEGTQEYQINFTAQTVRLEPDRAVLEYPELSLGNLDNPDLALRSREIVLRIGINPATGVRGVLAAELANASVSIFGVTVHFMPFPYYRSFVKIPRPGLFFPVPPFGWEGSQGLYIDESAYYNFLREPFTNGPYLRARVNAFPFDRSYPEVGAGGEFHDLTFDLRAGYRREETSEGDPIPVRAEPQLDIGLQDREIGDTGIVFGATAFVGHLRDMEMGVDSDRWGYSAELAYPDYRIGDLNLSGRIEFEDFYYEHSRNYRVLEGIVRMRYSSPPDWGATLSYEASTHWGMTPFRFDVPQVREELALREQTRLSHRWGAGFDWRWDVDADEFRRQEYHLTCIFDSFQMSLGWDFARDQARIQFALPGSLR